MFRETRQGMIILWDSPFTVFVFPSLSREPGGGARLWWQRCECVPVPAGGDALPGTGHSTQGCRLPRWSQWVLHSDPCRTPRRRQSYRWPELGTRGNCCDNLTPLGGSHIVLLCSFLSHCHIVAYDATLKENCRKPSSAIGKFANCKSPRISLD